MSAIHRRSWITASLLACAVASAAALADEPLEAVPRDNVACAGAEATPAGTQANSRFTFEGCWTSSPSGPCRDVYRDSSGNYWLCGLCGQTTKPGPGQCTRISIQTLNNGFWCS